ncbi:Unknown protein, partial [Striga hermonthica]
FPVHRITGFNGQTTLPEGEITLPIELGGVGPNGRRIMETFKVLKMNHEYNAILERTTLYKLKATVSIFHYSIKFPTENGIGVHYDNQREAQECIMKIPSLEIHSVMTTSEVQNQPLEPNEELIEQVIQTQAEHTEDDLITEGKPTEGGNREINNP